jgi:hypothetical protein
LVAALLQTMWPVMVLFNHFRKDQQSFSRHPKYIDFHAYWKWFDCNHWWLSEQQYGDKKSMVVMIIVGLLMAIITLYNYFTAPRTETSIPANANSEGSKKNFQYFSSFFQKKQIGLALLLSYF